MTSKKVVETPHAIALFNTLDADCHVKGLVQTSIINMETHMLNFWLFEGVFTVSQALLQIGLVKAAHRDDNWRLPTSDELAIFRKNFKISYTLGNYWCSLSKDWYKVPINGVVSVDIKTKKQEPEKSVIGSRLLIVQNYT